MWQIAVGAVKSGAELCEVVCAVEYIGAEIQVEILHLNEVPKLHCNPVRVTGSGGRP